MVTQITKGIKISVDTEFQGTYYKDTNLLYAFEYSISIENQSSDVVQLSSRHWVILDSLNNEEVVNGEGVIGKKPVLIIFNLVCENTTNFYNTFNWVQMGH